MRDPRKFYMGVDLGQAHDYTAITIVEQHVHDDGERMRRSYQAGHIERVPLGTSYPDQVARIKERLTELRGSPLRLNGQTFYEADVKLIVDATGVGRPVVDMLRQNGLKPTPVIITGADTETSSDGFYRVPKRNLVSIGQVLLQTGRLKIHKSLPLATELTKELLAFKVEIKKNGHDTYGNDWRENPHDDLVLAMLLAVYWPERFPTMSRRKLRQAQGFAA
jgi:hypothetical protein